MAYPCGPDKLTWQKRRSERPSYRGHVLNWIPGWNSAPDAEWWSNTYFCLGIASLLFLGLFEVTSHIYTLRKDYLTAEEQNSANKHNVADIAEARAQAKSAKDELARLREKSAPRHLTEEQKERLIATLAKYPNQKVQVWSIAGNKDSIDFANEFMRVFELARWQATKRITQLFGANPVGIEVAVNESYETGKPPDAAINLIYALEILQIIPKRETSARTSLLPIGSDPQVPMDEIKFFVGEKAP
jgi:hypothetical protein